jgi:hypothetical protein
MSETYYRLADAAANQGDTANADRMWRIATVLYNLGR